MARIGLDLTQRMIVNQWVSFLDELGVLKSIPRLNGVKEMPDFEQVKDVPLLGYVYVDHDAGISLKVEGLYQSAGVHDPEIEINFEIYQGFGEPEIQVRYNPDDRFQYP